MTAIVMTMPLLIFAQVQFFNNNVPCIGRMDADDCGAAMSDVASMRNSTSNAAVACELF